MTAVQAHGVIEEFRCPDCQSLNVSRQGGAVGVPVDRQVFLCADCRYRSRRWRFRVLKPIMLPPTEVRA